VRKALLDTDVLSAITRHHPIACPRAQAYQAIHGRFTFSIISRFEVLRGLKARGATTLHAAFEQICTINEVLPLTDPIVVRASEIYASLARSGALIGDADILIAATALEHGLIVATNNVAHFSRIAGLIVENWLLP
jgi:tRNA(fMet)-specific endonuclease VapC